MLVYWSICHREGSWLKCTQAKQKKKCKLNFFDPPCKLFHFSKLKNNSTFISFNNCPCSTTFTQFFQFGKLLATFSRYYYSNSNNNNWNVNFNNNNHHNYDNNQPLNFHRNWTKWHYNNYHHHYNGKTIDHFITTTINNTILHPCSICLSIG